MMVNNLQDKYKPPLFEFLIEFYRMDFDTFLNVVNDQKIEEVLLKLPQQMPPVTTCVLIDKGLVLTEVKNTETFYCLLILQKFSRKHFFALILNACVKIQSSKHK